MGIFRSFINFYLLILIIPWVTLNAQEIWIPFKLKISQTGEVVNDFPFPISANPGPAFYNVDPYFAGVKIGLGGEITNFKRIYAVSGKNTGQLTQASTGVFLPPNDSAGYNVLETKNVELTLSIAPTVVLVDGWLGIDIDFAITGTYARGYLSSRWVPSLAAADGLPLISTLPKNAEEIKKNWKPGDSVSTSRTMGVGLDVATGIKIYASVGVIAKIDSTWNVSLYFPEKKENPSGKPLVVVSYARRKDKKFGVYGYNFLTDVSMEKVWGKGQTITYMFDLSNTQKFNIEMNHYKNDGRLAKALLKDIYVLEAYQEALKGNLFLAERLALLKNFGVKKIQVEDKTENSTKYGVGATIPWLFKATYKKGKSFSQAKVERVGSDMMLENILSFYSQESGTNGIISADMKRLNVFSGNFQQVTPLNAMDLVLTRRYSGNYKYHYAKNRATRSEFEDELKKLRYRVGFMKELKEFQNVPENIGSLEIDLDILLSNIATDELINLALKYPASIFEKEALSYIDGFFENVSDAKEEICKHYKVRVLDECIFTTKRQTSSAIQKAHKGLLKMKEYKNQNDYNKFVSSFADFGEGFIENRFSMKTFLRMLRYEYNPSATGKDKFGAERKVKDEKGRLTKIPYEVVLNIRGTNMAPYNKVLYSWENNTPVKP